MRDAPTRRAVLALAAAAAMLCATPALADKATHRLAIQVNSNDAGVMNLTLNNVSNVAEYYKGIGEDVQIEIVAYGPGLHMLRADTSPVKDRVAALKKKLPNVAFAACGNTMAGMKKQESREISLLPEATVVQSGVVRLMQLQEQNWTYIRP